MDPCCVCLDNFGSPPKGWMRLFCGHVYHRHCFEGLVDDLCPLCRTSIRCKTFTVKITAGGREMTFTPFQDPCCVDGAMHSGRFARSIIRDFIGSNQARYDLFSEPGLIYSIATHETTALVNYFTLHPRSSWRFESKVAQDVQHLRLENRWNAIPLMALFYLVST